MPLPVQYREQGTSVAKYEERGPYSCAKCIHKLHPNVPICIHPEVISDPQLKEKRCWCDNPPSGTGVFINLEHGCCGYVKIE